jgi:peptidoglycan/xylan/chitin deacetylase (PgdA/CDA1 family)
VLSLASLRHRTVALGRLARRRAAAPGAVVLGYHDVVADDAPRGPWDVTASQLRSHLRVVERCGMAVVDLGMIVDRRRAGEPVDGLAAVTFDDALTGVRTRAVEVLTALGMTATVFVVTGHLGVDPPWWPGASATLDADGVRELAAAGWTIGSHTRHHPSLVACDGATLASELRGSRDDLAELTGAAPRLLAYPHGHHGPAVRRAAAEAGYDAAVTFLNGRVEGGTDLLRLPRLTMGAHLGVTRLALQLARPASSWPDHQLDHVTGTVGWP